MNLESMRSADWTGLVKKYALQYSHILWWGDNDIVNAILHFHPSKICHFGMFLPVPQLDFEERVRF